MSALFNALLDEVRNSSMNKIAAAPVEPPSPDQQNSDILEMSQATISKIDSFMSQVGGMGQDLSQEDHTQNNQNPNDGQNADGNAPNQSNSQTVRFEVPAGVSVKVASEITDANSALATIISLTSAYFGE